MLSSTNVIKFVIVVKLRNLGAAWRLSGYHILATFESKLKQNSSDIIAYPHGHLCLTAWKRKKRIHASNKEESWARLIKVMFTIIITRVSSRDESHACISRSPRTVFSVQSFCNIIM